MLFRSQYLFRPLALAIAAGTGHPIVEMPGLDSSLWELMFGMLGLGGLRTMEKLNGVASK